MTEYSVHAVDQFIRAGLSGDHRVGTDSISLLRQVLKSYVERVIQRGWENAQAADRATIRAADIDVEQIPSKDALQLTISSTKEISRNVLPDAAQVSSDAVLSMVSIVEEYGQTIIRCAELFMKHAGRNTLQAADIELYFELFTGLPE